MLNHELVYDSHGDTSEDSRFPLPKRPVSVQILKDLPASYDRHQFKQMKNYPPSKPRIPSKPGETGSLEFDSHFESGNLHKAFKVTDFEYNLQLEFDTETEGYTQWFYFSVSNGKPGTSVRFNIINLMKFESLYNNGLRPLVFLPEIGWHRDCSQICYFKNTMQRPSNRGTYYTLTFKYTFQSAEKVYFAHCYPYTFTDLNAYLASIADEQILRVNTLCKTLAGNPCPILTITQDVQTLSWDEELMKIGKTTAGRRLLKLRELKQGSKIKKEHLHKKVVFLTGRVHPGESNSSFMMKGAIDFLMSSNAALLRKYFIFKVIPMLNPDGVIYGNYRCSLLGVDLNRRWKHPNLHMHPTVYYAKKMVETMNEDFGVVLFSDFHGHSVQRNVFLYGCFDKNLTRENVFIKLVPFYMARTNELFSFKSCKFRLEKDKESTARIVLFKELGILNSFTLEASFYGKDQHMDTQDLEKIGQDFIRQMFMFVSPAKYRKKLLFLVNYFRQEEEETRKKFEIKSVCKKEKIEKKTEIEQETDTNDTQLFAIDDAINLISEDMDLGCTEEQSDSDESFNSEFDDRKIIYLQRKKQKKKGKPKPRSQVSYTTCRCHQEEESVPRIKRRYTKIKPDPTFFIKKHRFIEFKPIGRLSSQSIRDPEPVVEERVPKTINIRKQEFGTPRGFNRTHRITNRKQTQGSRYLHFLINNH